MWVALIFNLTDSLISVVGPFRTENEAWNWASQKFSLEYRIKTKPLIPEY